MQNNNKQSQIKSEVGGELSERISANIVKLLQDYGLTLQKIAEFAGLSESFVSRVAKQKYRFNFKSITRITQETNIPVAYLLLKCTPIDIVSPAKKKFHDDVVSLLEKHATLVEPLNDIEKRIRAPRKRDAED